MLEKQECGGHTTSLRVMTLKPVNDVIGQFHFIENCRSVLDKMIIIIFPFILGCTFDPGNNSSSTAAAHFNVITVYY